MIYIYNFSIALISSISIVIIHHYHQIILRNHFKNHIIIFAAKLFFISMFIYLFIYNLNISNYKIFIVSGVFNFTFFHILEGFYHQKLINNEIKK